MIYKYISIIDLTLTYYIYKFINFNNKINDNTLNLTKVR